MHDAPTHQPCRESDNIGQPSWPANCEKNQTHANQDRLSQLEIISAHQKNNGYRAGNDRRQHVIDLPPP